MNVERACYSYRRSQLSFLPCHMPSVATACPSCTTATRPCTIVYCRGRHHGGRRRDCFAVCRTCGVQQRVVAFTKLAPLELLHRVCNKLLRGVGTLRVFQAPTRMKLRCSPLSRLVGAPNQVASATQGQVQVSLVRHTLTTCTCRSPCWGSGRGISVVLQALPGYGTCGPHQQAQTAAPCVSDAHFGSTHMMLVVGRASFTYVRVLHSTHNKFCGRSSGYDSRAGHTGSRPNETCSVQPQHAHVKDLVSLTSGSGTTLPCVPLQ